MWHCRLQGCTRLTVVNLTRPASCAATALPSCFPPSGNRAASTWRLRSSSADASEDAFLVAPAPELVHTDERGHKYVAYSRVAPLLVGAVQQLRDELAELRAELAEERAARARGCA